MEGWWYNVFSVPFVHIGDIQLGVGFDMSNGPLWWVPERLMIGGKVCFGSQSSCATSTGNFIRGATYVGLSAANPDDNYFIGMITTATIGKVFGIFGDTLDDVFHTWSEVIPKPLRYRYISIRIKCSTPPTAVGSKGESKVPKAKNIDLNCYAYLSASPRTDVKVP